jgi:hypothetical protein
MRGIACSLVGGKWISDLKATAPVAAAARQVLTVRREVVRDHLAFALHKADEDPEHIHRFRVGTRRARAALDIFAYCLPVNACNAARKQLRGIRPYCWEQPRIKLPRKGIGVPNSRISARNSAPERPPESVGEPPCIVNLVSQTRAGWPPLGYAGRYDPLILAPRERHRSGTGLELFRALAVCVLARLSTGGADSFVSSPYVTLSRGASSASSLVTPPEGSFPDRAVPVCSTDS